MTSIALALITSPGITGRIAGGQDTVMLEHIPVFRGLHHECLEAILRKS